MKKNIFKVLSVMCSVTALAGMFSINSASAMDGKEANQEKQLRPVPQPLVRCSEDSTSAAEVSQVSSSEEESALDLRLFESLKEKFPSMTEEEFQELKRKVTLEDGRPLRSGETLEDRMVMRYKNKKDFEKQREESREVFLKKLEQKEEDFFKPVPTKTSSELIAEKSEVSLQKETKARELKQKSSSVNDILRYLHKGIADVSASDIRNSDGTIDVNKFVLACVSKLENVYQNRFNFSLVNSLFNNGDIVDRMVRHMSENTNMSCEELHVLMSLMNSLLGNVGHRALSESTYGDDEVVSFLRETSEKFKILKSVVESMTNAVNVLMTKDVEEAGRDLCVSKIISLIEKMDRANYELLTAKAELEACKL